VLDAETFPKNQVEHDGLNFLDQACHQEIQTIMLDLILGESLGVQHFNISRNDAADMHGYATMMLMAKHEGIPLQPPTEEEMQAPAARPKIGLKPKAESVASEVKPDGQPIIKIKKNRALSITGAAEGVTA